MRTKPLALIMVFVLAAAGGCGSDGSTLAPSPSEPTASPAPEPHSDPPAAAPTMTDPSLGVEIAATGLTEPTGLAFLSADEFFVTEKSTGHVHRVVNGQPGEPVLDLAVNYFDERGLLGIALHPQFSTNGFVYLYWTSSGEGDGDDGRLGPDTDEEHALPDLGNRVDRFVWDGTTLIWDRNLLRLRSNTLETDTSGRIRGNHDAGPLAFGRDGKLYVVNGDQNQRSQLQNLSDGPPPDDINFAGAVLRINDDGSTPHDNPFFEVGAAMGGEAGHNVQLIWAYGVRNSFGLAVHPDTGDLWATENGDDSWDEVNILPAGANSGWIQLIGPPERFEQYKQIEVESEDGLDNADVPPESLAESADEALERMFDLPGSTYVPPVFAWKHPLAVTSVAFVTDSRLGESSANTVWLGTVLTDALYRFPMSADGSTLDLAGGLADNVDDNAAKGDVGESVDYVVGVGFGVVTHIVAAPDDLLYVASISAGAVYRVGPSDRVGGAPPSSGTPVPASHAPSNTAEITVGTDAGSALTFEPAAVSVPPGAHVTLTFENRSAVPHNLTFGAPINAATSTVVPAGGSESLEFVAPIAGEQMFLCSLHPEMKGSLTIQ